jgi:phosphopantetheinyl transferase
MGALGGWADPSTSLLVAWTIKEAALKATGRGLSVPPSTVRIRSIGPDGRVTVTVDRPDLSAACWREEGAVVAVACAGTRDLPELSISRGAQ